MRKMLFIVNPKAGRTTLKNSLVDVLDAFCKSGIDTRVYITQDADDAARIVYEEGANYDMITCAGGDGTLDNTVSGYMKAGLHKPFGYIPCGSTNDFAKSLDISIVASNAAKIIANGTTFPIDIGKFDEDYFIYVAAFGIFSDVSYATPQGMKNILGHTAYVLQGIKSIVSIPTYHLEIEYDGEKVEGDYIYGMVSNSTSVGGMKSIVSRGVEFDDGLFEGVFIEKIHSIMDLQRIMNSLLSGNAKGKNIVSFRAANVKIKSSDAIPWTLDGEFGGDKKEVDISVCQKALDLIVYDGDIEEEFDRLVDEAKELEMKEGLE